MKQITTILLSFILLTACSTNTNKEETETVVNSPLEKATTSDTTNQSVNQSELNTDLDEIPSSGKYLYDIAFAEWQGKSMGEKASVIIDGNSIKVIYEGEGKQVAFKKGQVIDEGIILKHKSGVWIIGKKESDKELDEIGGCSGGPAIIDFKNKKYKMC